MPQEGAIVILLASDEGVGLQRCRRSQGTSIFSNRGKQLDRVMRLGRNRRVKESNESGCAKRAADSLPFIAWAGLLRPQELLRWPAVF